jgi:CRISPR-associated protein Cmr5
MASRTMEQERALFALEQINEIKESETRAGDDSKRLRKYATFVRRLPTMVLQNGLGQALAFLLADAEGNDGEPSKWLYDQLQEWLLGPPQDDRPERVYSNKDLIEELVAGSRDDYRRAQIGALGLLSWMRKFADAYLPKGESSDE